VSSDLASSLAADDGDGDGDERPASEEEAATASAPADQHGGETDETLPNDGLSAFQWLVVGSGTTIAITGLGAALAGALEVSTPVLLLVGAGTLLLAGWRGYTYAVTGIAVTDLPTVGLRAGVRRVGSDLDEAIRSADGTGQRRWDGTGQERGSARVTVRRYLEPLATTLVADRADCSEEEATERLQEGTWTDDPGAARLFELGAEESRLRRLLGLTPSVSAQARAVVDELGPNVLGPTESKPPDPGETRASEEQRWEPTTRETGRWREVSAAGLATLAAAVFVRVPGLVLVAAVLLGVAGYARLGRAPRPALAVERTVDDEDPVPGDHVTVTVTVTNAGETLLPDLRVVDDVPADLRVVDGSPRHATALRPGEETSVEYDVLAVYGDHDFERLYTASYDASGHHERTGETSDGHLTLSCEPRPVQESVPLHPQTTGVTGRVTTDTGGSGHEFHSVREYRRGDPLRRVDWNRVARTGELATLQFREEHAATVVVLVDTRAASFQAPDRDALSAVDRSLAGTAQVIASLLADGDRVGLASVGLD